MVRHRKGSSRMLELLEQRMLLSAVSPVRNGGFEGTVSPSDWTLEGAFQADSRFTTVHTGAGYAYLATTSGGAGNSLTGTMSQTLTLPTGLSSVTLTFWTRITTAETTSSVVKDSMVVRVMDPTGTTTLQTLGTVSNLDSNTAYVAKGYAIDRSLWGQSVRLVFSASTDAVNATTFRVDDVGIYAVTPATSNRVVGYLPDYEFTSAFNRLDLSQLTHINYFSIAASSANDGSISTGGVTLSRLQSVIGAAHEQGVTVSITVGPASFATIAANATARANFANNLVNYAIANGFDGVDIDWEPPASTATNKANYGLLIDDLYTAGHSKGMLITAAVNPWTFEIPTTTVNTKMDWLNVMCYDFDFANHSTYAAAIDGMQRWTGQGVAKNKLVMGLPFYGRSGTSWSNSTSKTYGNILASYLSINGAMPALDVDNYTDSGGTKWYFNGVMTIAQKAAWVRDNSYGGLMTWELGQDNWDTGNKYGQYSLVPVMNANMRVPSGILVGTTDTRFDLVAGTFTVLKGSATLTADMLASNPGLNVVVNNGATLMISAATEHLGTLTIADGGTVTMLVGGTRTLVVTSLNVGANAKLDLNDNALVIDYTGASPASTIVTRLSSGRNGGAWTGKGIVSGKAGLDASKNTAIGWAEASQLGLTSFRGQALDATSLILKYTYYGDTNLSGSVDFDDMLRTDRGFAKGTAGWGSGDFDYSGALTSADYDLLNKAWAANGPVISDPEGVAVEPMLVAALAAVAPDQASTPEVSLVGQAQGKARKAMVFRVTIPAGSRRIGIDWNGDGRIDQVIKGKPGKTVNLRHVFRMAGNYQPVAYQMDRDGASESLDVRVV